MKWIDIIAEKPKKIDEYIITYANNEGVKESGSAWWNGTKFEDWGDNIINGVIGWMPVPKPM